MGGSLTLRSGAGRLHAWVVAVGFKVDDPAQLAVAVVTLATKHIAGVPPHDEVAWVQFRVGFGRMLPFVKVTHIWELFNQRIS